MLSISKKLVFNQAVFAQLIIIINPFVDIIFNLLNKANTDFPLNQILRLVIMGAAMLYLKRKQSYLMIITFTITLTIGLIAQCFAGFSLSLYSDIGFAVKLLSALVLFLFYYESVSRNVVNIEKLLTALTLSAFIIEINIFACVLFGIGTINYGSANNIRMNGYLGYMSGNSITAISLLILLSANIIIHLKKKQYIPIVLNIVALVLIMSKFAIIGTAMSLATFYFYDLFTSKKYEYSNKVLFGLILSAAVLFVSLPFLINYFNNLADWSASQRYTDFYTMLTSNRGLQIDIITDNYINKLDAPQKLISTLFGSGYSKTNHILHEIKYEFRAIEWDFHGLFYYSGLIVCAVETIFILNILKKGLFFIKHRYKTEGILVITLCICIVYAFMGGHVLYESMTLQYLSVIAAVISVLYDTKHKRYTKPNNVKYM